MKMRKRLSYMCHVLAGFVLSLTGIVHEGSAAIPHQGEGSAGSVGNVAQPGSYARKNHEVAFESRGGMKTRSVIGVQSDGTVYGFVTRQERLAQNGRTTLSKKKSWLYMQTPQRRNTRGRMLKSQPARGAKSGLIAHKPAARKSHAFVDKPAQGKVKPIIHSPQRGINQGSSNYLRSRPAKRKLIMNSPRRGMQPGRGQMLESRPGKSKSIICCHNDVPITDEQKEQLVFGSRDYLWDLNTEDRLERHLPDGIRVVIGERGMVDVFDSGNRSVGQFHSSAAEKMDRALRITQNMKEMIREDGRSLG